MVWAWCWENISLQGAQGTKHVDFCFTTKTLVFPKIFKIQSAFHCYCCLQIKNVSPFSDQKLATAKTGAQKGKNEKYEPSIFGVLSLVWPWPWPSPCLSHILSLFAHQWQIWQGQGFTDGVNINSEHHSRHKFPCFVFLLIFELILTPLFLIFILWHQYQIWQGQSLRVSLSITLLVHSSTSHTPENVKNGPWPVLTIFPSISCHCLLINVKSDRAKALQMGSI